MSRPDDLVLETFKRVVAGRGQLEELPVAADLVLAKDPALWNTPQLQHHRNLLLTYQQSPRIWWTLVEMAKIGEMPR
jgi:hypothetical protein